MGVTSRLTLWGAFKKGITPPEKVTDCWIWKAALDANGYGRVSQTIRPGRYNTQRKLFAHVVSYRFFVGPVPEGKILDHICHSSDLTCLGGKCLHRACVNPLHLEPVTHKVNSERETMKRTTCKYGHPFSGENLYLEPSGKRRCRMCMRERGRIHDKKRGWRR